MNELNAFAASFCLNIVAVAETSDSESRKSGGVSRYACDYIFCKRLSIISITALGKSYCVPKEKLKTWQISITVGAAHNALISLKAKKSTSSDGLSLQTMLFWADVLAGPLTFIFVWAFIRESHVVWKLLTLLQYWNQNTSVSTICDPLFAPRCFKNV